MSFEKCQRCQKYRWDDKCGCQPYHVDYIEWFGEEGKTIYGTSFEEVVETLATAINSDEPKFDEYLFETDITVTDKNGESKMFNCIASLNIDYSVKDRGNPPHSVAGGRKGWPDLMTS